MTPDRSKISPAQLLRAVAMAILAAGLLSGWLIDRQAARDRAITSDQDPAAAPLAPADSKHYGYQVGQMTGETGVLADNLARGAGWLAHGRPLAALIVAVAFAGAGALLVAADRSQG